MQNIQEFPESIELVFNLTRTRDTTPALDIAYLLGHIENQISSDSLNEDTFQVLQKCSSIS